MAVAANSLTPGDGELDLLTLFRVVHVYRRSIAAVALVGAIIALAFALILDPVYRAEIVVIEATDRGMGGAESLAGQFGGLASLAGINLQAGGAGRESAAVLKSNNLIDEFIRRHDLILTLLANERKDRQTLWWASREFKKNVLSINEDTRSFTTTVAVEWKDPKIASAWANDFVALANELMRLRAMDEAARSLTYLKKQLEETNVVPVRESIYRLIEAQTKTMMLTNARTEYSFKIVDPARPPEFKERPRRTLMVALGAFFGFLVGSIAAFIHRSIDRSRKQSGYSESN